MKNEFLNVGCGKHYHKDWINVDFVSDSNYVIAHNLLKGIPFENNSFSVVYHSHVLEHFSPQEGVFLIDECFRVLKSGGTLRIAIPDLEQIAKNYLLYLDEADRHNDDLSDFKYEWSKLELIDQIARNVSGGVMANYINTALDTKFDFIKSRLGMEIQRGKIPVLHEVKNRYWNALKNLNFKKVRYYLGYLAVSVIGGRDFGSAFKIGYFRTFTGENHRWMYDRYSLKKLLHSIGFKDIKVCAPNESRIKNFNDYQLDVVDNKTRKPDSLFIEATKL